MHKNFDFYPLSIPQKALWLEWLKAPDSMAYNFSFVYQIKGKLNIDLLRKVLDRLMNNYLNFNVYLYEEKDTAYQAVPHSVKNVLEVINCHDLDREVLNKIIQTKLKTPFDIYKPPLCRFILVSQSEYLNYFLISYNHLIMDGTSIEVLHYEISKTYNNFASYQNNIDNLPKVSDWLEYENRLPIDKINNSKDFWKKYLDEANFNVDLPTFKNNPTDDAKGSIAHFYSESLLTSIQTFADESDYSLFEILLSSFFLLLYKYTHQKDTTVCYPLNLRPTKLQKLLGYYVGLQPVRVIIDDTVTFSDILGQIREYLTNSGTKLSYLMSFAKESVEYSNVTFGKSNFVTDSIKFNDLDIESLDIEWDNQNDVTFLYDIVGERIEVRIQYDKTKFPEVFINQLVNHYETILKDLTALSQYPVINYSVLKELELEEIIHNRNNNERQYIHDKTIQDIFVQQVQKQPSNIAIVASNLELTYAQFDQAANKLANYINLNHPSYPANESVTLFLERDEDLIIAIFGVLKSGMFYLPISLDDPDERIAVILKDSNTKMIVTNSKHKARLEQLVKSISKNIVVVDVKDALADGSLSKVKASSHVSSTDLAYVLYTSGTTGNPKGVMVEHKAVVNFCVANNFYLADINTVTLAYANYAFDGSIFDIFYTLLNGGKLVIADKITVVDSVYVYELAKKYSVNNLFLTTSLFSYYSTLESNNPLGIIENIVIGGERISSSDLKRCLKNFPNTRFVNLYGPTENIVFATYCIINADNVEISPIGKRLSDKFLYVLDKNHNPVPMGVMGELYVGGIGIARGYLNKDDLTAEKFLQNPFERQEKSKLDREEYDHSLAESHNSRSKSRMYKTGDLVRWLPDGNLEYIGRNDFQVKIRGHRIELQEIEVSLSSYPGIQQSIVLVKEKQSINEKNTPVSSKYLIGYYVAKHPLLEKEILDYLQLKLPDYMVPNRLIYLTSLPLTKNGKLDIKSLPSQDLISGYNNNYVAPRNEIEEKIVQVWAEVLGIPLEKISITDSFSQLGGDSILSIELANKIQKKLGLKINIKDVFAYKTVEKFYNNVLSQKVHNEVLIKTEQGLLQGDMLLLPIQQWFFQSDLKKPNHWNQSFLIKTPELDLDRLKISINELIKYHDAFRLKYRRDPNENNYIQYYSSNDKPELLEVLDIRSLGLQQDSQELNQKLQVIFTDWQDSFNFEQGPTYKLGYIHGYSDGTARIFFALHHLIIDAVSWRILTEDLQNIYQEYKLPDKGSSYRQWVDMVRTSYKKTYASEIPYWNNILDSCGSIYPSLEDMLVSTHDRNFLSFALDQNETIKFLQQASKAYNTQVNDILLTALAYTLFKFTGSNINNITLEGHGRENIDSSLDITRTVGWFTTMYPVRLEVYGEVSDTLKNVKETLRQIPNKGIGYGALMQDRLMDLPKISFNYLGQLNKGIESKIVDNWHIVNEASGLTSNPLNEDCNIININCFVTNNILKFDILAKLDQGNITKLADLFKQELQELISHCVSKATDISIDNYTASDFDDFEPYVVLHQVHKVAKNKLFFFPPGGFGIESYFDNIATRLDSLELILFNNFYSYYTTRFGINNINFMTYEKLAVSYINYMRSIQSKGPYHLFGWSFGGTLAFEVAKQLCTMGEKVDNLIMLDAYFNYKKAMGDLNTPYSDQHNINYLYHCEKLNDFPVKNITLFKATQKETINNHSVDDEIYNIMNYYVDKEFNYLDTLIDRERVKLITVHSTHMSFLKVEQIVKKICIEIQKLVSTV